MKITPSEISLPLVSPLIFACAQVCTRSRATGRGGQQCAHGMHVPTREMLRTRDFSQTERISSRSRTPPGRRRVRRALIVHIIASDCHTRRGAAVGARYRCTRGKKTVNDTFLRS